MHILEPPKSWTREERKAAYVLAGIATGEGVWAYFNIVGRAGKFWRFIGGPISMQPGMVGWVLGLAVAALFVCYSVRIPSVRATMFEVSRLKFLGLALACGASLCEESIFRKWLMDSLQSHGSSVAMQIAASAVAFGALHGIWAFLGRNVWAGVGAITATTILGACLAIVYLANSRVLLPCIVAHFLIDAVIEPGLILAGLRGEMGRALQPRPSVVA
jgi:membrane protease YdiL (CAAX protease family)